MPDLDITVFSDDPADTRSQHSVDAFHHPAFPLNPQSLTTLIASRKETCQAIAALRQAALFISFIHHLFDKTLCLFMEWRSRIMSINKEIGINREHAYRLLSA